MSIFNSINISASGLTAERLRMDIIAKNIANADTTRTAAGTPYRRQIAIFETKDNNSTPFAEYLRRAEGRETELTGVEVVSVQNDSSPFKRVHDPGHPDADEDGYVSMPNVDTVMEMANFISATRAYDSNVTAINGTKAMALKALEIGK